MDTSLPLGIAGDSSGNVYFADPYYKVVRYVDNTGRIIPFAGQFGSYHGTTGDGGPALSAQLWGPLGLFIDANDDVFIGDCGSSVDVSVVRVVFGSPPIPPAPTVQPTAHPSAPTIQPTAHPSAPTLQPTAHPSAPTLQPTAVPSMKPVPPTSFPTTQPTLQVYHTPYIHCHLLIILIHSLTS